jgi:hypothetical protein
MAPMSTIRMQIDPVARGSMERMRTIIDNQLPFVVDELFALT